MSQTRIDESVARDAVRAVEHTAKIERLSFPTRCAADWRVTMTDGRIADVADLGRRDPQLSPNRHHQRTNRSSQPDHRKDPSSRTWFRNWDNLPAIAPTPLWSYLVYCSYQTNTRPQTPVSRVEPVNRLLLQENGTPIAVDASNSLIHQDHAEQERDLMAELGGRSDTIGIRQSPNESPPPIRC